MKIQKFQTTPNNLLFLIVFLNIVLTALTIDFGFPGYVIYITDLLNILVFLFALKKTVVFGIEATMLNTLVCIYCVYGIMGSIINYEGLIQFGWGLRNNLRFFVFLFSCTLFLRIHYYDVLNKVVLVCFWLSLPLCFVEKIYYDGLYGAQSGYIVSDYIGGVLFGASGVNSFLNVIIFLALIYYTDIFFKNTLSIVKYVLVIMSSFYMAAVAELKVFVVEYIIILIFYILTSKRNHKQKFILTLAVLASAFIVEMFAAYNGNGAKDYSELLSVQGMLSYITNDTGYTGVGDLNRFTGIQTMINTMWNGDYFKILFGIGMGSGEYSSFFQSAFYNSFKYLHYYWQQINWLFIENGLVGLVLFFSTIICSWVNTVRLKNDERKQQIMLILVMCVIVVFYNLSLRSTEAGFLLYSYLAYPAVVKRERYFEVGEDMS